MIEQEIIEITIHIEKQLADQIEYIAKYDDMSINEEYDQIIREWIQAFEETYGKIDLKAPLV